MVDKNKMVKVLKQMPIQNLTAEKGELMIIPKNQQGTLTTSHQQIKKQDN
jgi:ethanolamine utilization protein EutQ (cupin superfamily)